MINATLIKICSQSFYIMKAIVLVTLFACIFAANGWIAATHDIHGAASKCIFNGIKYELYLFPYSAFTRLSPPSPTRPLLLNSPMISTIPPTRP